MSQDIKGLGKVISVGSLFIKFPYLLLLISVFIIPFLILPFALIGGLSDSNQGGGAPLSGDVPYAGYINEAAVAHDLDPSLLAAVIQQESNFNPNVVSPAGAQGLMQLMPFNSKGIDPFNPRENIMRGAEILAGHMETYDGNLSLALAAYNAGPGAVKKYGGVPPYLETKNYVKKTTANYQKMRQTTIPVMEDQIKGKGLMSPVGVEPGCDINCYKGHTGQDYPGALGTPVYASAGGIVKEVQTPMTNSRLGEKRSYGTLVKIDHGGGLETWYAHMFPKDIEVQSGQSVRRGQKIGAIGNFGNSTGPHLHFEVRKNNKVKNPLNYVKGKPKEEKGDEKPFVPDPMFNLEELLKKRGEKVK